MVGNDFLPHCPHLDIDNAALSLMLNNYIDLLPEWGGYLTDKERIQPDRFEQFLYHIAALEEDHFKRRGYEEDEPGWQLSSVNESEDIDFYGQWYGGGPTPKSVKKANAPLTDEEKDFATNTRMESYVSAGSCGDGGVEKTTSALRDMKDPRSKVAKKFRKKYPNNVTRSYRDFYYGTKLGWSSSTENRNVTLRNRRAQVRDYLEGLHWVLHYYHKGCLDWSWYFPHLYSPLCTDMVNLYEFYEEWGINDDDGGFKTFKFERNDPFPSLAQLLSVLPPQSAGLLPLSLGELMTEPSSPIAKYYPRDFSTDLNGKRQPWEVVVKIPFIDGEVVLDIVNSVLVKSKDTNEDNDETMLLTPAERRRNERGRSRLFESFREAIFQSTSHMLKNKTGSSVHGKRHLKDK